MLIVFWICFVGSLRYEGTFAVSLDEYFDSEIWVLTIPAWIIHAWESFASPERQKHAKN